MSSKELNKSVRRRWAAFEPMRIRIMQEAYDCADKGDFEAYNSIKVMCGEVLKLAEEMVLAEREACAKVCDEHPWSGCAAAIAIRARGQG